MKLSTVLLIAVAFLLGAWIDSKYPTVNLIGKFVPAP